MESVAVFSSRKRLEKLLFATCGKEARKKKRLIKAIARDAQKSYQLGIEDGTKGKPIIRFEGLNEVSAKFKNEEIGRAVMKFHYEAYTAGYAIGKAKEKVLGEVTA